MNKDVERYLKRIPVINRLVSFLKRLKPSAFGGLSTYDLLELYIIGIARGAVSIRASAIAFTFFTAMFPFLLFILKLIPFIPDKRFGYQFSNFLGSFLPPETADFFFDNIFQNINMNIEKGRLSYIFLLSIILMTSAVAAVFDSFQNSYHDQLSRSTLKHYLYALGVALILAFILIFTVATYGYIELYLSGNLDGEIIIGAEPNIWLQIIKFLVFTVMIYLATATLYYYGTKEGKDSRFLSIGALITTLLIIFTSYLFGLYIENFGRYNELYGSIGALLILLFYFWINSNILLLGYEFNASMNQIKKSTNRE